MVWKLDFYCQILLNKFVAKTQTFQSFFWQCWYISNFASESKCRSQRERKLDAFRNMNVRNIKGCTSRAVLLMVRKLVEPSNLPVSKVRQFSQSKHSYTEFTFATPELKRMKASFRLNYEISCMDRTYADKLAKDMNGGKCLIVRQNLLDRTVDAKGMKTNDSWETVRAFLKTTTKKNRPTDTWVDKGTEVAREFKKLWKTEGIKVYYTMSETKAAFA